MTRQAYSSRFTNMTGEIVLSTTFAEQPLAFPSREQFRRERSEAALQQNR